MMEKRNTLRLYPGEGKTAKSLWRIKIGDLFNFDEQLLLLSLAINENRFLHESNFLIFLIHN